MGGLSYTPAHGSFFSVYSYPELFNSYNMNVRAFGWMQMGKSNRHAWRTLLYFWNGTKDKALYTPEFHFAFGYNFVCKTFQSGFLIGTYGGGLYLLHRNTGELSFLQSDQCFMQGSFNGYERDVNNKLWIGSSKGVYVYDHWQGNMRFITVVILLCR